MLHQPWHKRCTQSSAKRIYSYGLVASLLTIRNTGMSGESRRPLIWGESLRVYLSSSYIAAITAIPLFSPSRAHGHWLMVMIICISVIMKLISWLIVMQWCWFSVCLQERRNLQPAAVWNICKKWEEKGSCEVKTLLHWLVFFLLFFLSLRK